MSKGQRSQESYPYVLRICTFGVPLRVCEQISNDPILKNFYDYAVA